AVGLGLLLLFFVLAVARESGARETQMELEASFDARATHYFKTPTLTLGDGATRVDSSTTLPSVGPLTFGGVAGGVGVAVDRHWVFPLLGFGFNAAAGHSPRVVSSADGSITEVRSWTAWTYDVQLPGVGFRAKEGRWMYGVLVRGGLTFLFMN